MSATTAFHAGQLVRARTDAQGLRPDELYVVATVRERATPFGTFVAYGLTPADGRNPRAPIVVTNGHLVLEAL